MSKEKTENKQGFWYSWMGKSIPVMAFLWIFNMKKVWKDIVAPAAELVKELGIAGWEKLDELRVSLGPKVDKALKAVMKMNLLVMFIVTVLWCVGAHYQNPTPIAAGMIIGGLYGLVLWAIMLDAIAALLVGAVKLTTSFLSSFAGNLLEKVRLKKPETGNLEVDLENVRLYLREKLFVIVPAFLFGGTILLMFPSWEGMAFALTLGAVAFTVAMIAANRGWDTDFGWKIAGMICMICMLFIVSSFLLGKISPETYESLGLGHFSKWFSSNDYRAQHSFWGGSWLTVCVTISAVAAVLWYWASKFEGERGRRLSYVIRAGWFVLVVAVFLHNGPFSNKVKGAYAKYTNDCVELEGCSETSNASSAKTADDTSQATAMKELEFAKKMAAQKKANFPNFAGTDPKPNTQTAPDVPIVPRSKRKARKKAPSKFTSKVEPDSIKKKSTPKQGDGYDRATALLDEVGL